MARRLAMLGVSSDVVDRGRLHKAIETLTTLPEDASATDAFVLESVEGYDAFLQVGPWQNPRAVCEILRRRSPADPYFYLPRGGLAQIEFKGRRGIKKFPYFALIEAHFLKSADVVVFSSEAERCAMTWLYRRGSEEAIIPDYFDPPPATKLARRHSSILRVGLLAQISPLKGLLPFMQAFAQWAQRRPQGEAGIRLTVGGGVRAGSERYLAQVREISTGIPGVEVTYCGPVSHADRPSFYANTDLFITPSLSESFGLTVLEATSAGCALLCSPHLGVLENFHTCPRVIVFDDLTSSGIEAGLDRAVLALKQAGGRRLSMNAAANTVARINALADQRWRQFLGLQRDGVGPS
jgi:glycosyltransferase involved in cell wall biosynthesis